MNSIKGLLDKVQQAPIKNADGRMLGASTLLLAIITPLYATSNWPVLDTLFKNVAAGSAKVAFILADEYNDRDQSGKYTTNTAVAFQSIDCLDYTYNTDLTHMQSEAQRIAQVAPVMGPFFSYGGIACWNWPYEPTRTPAPVHATGSAPILVVGTTNDPATPYQESVNLAGDLDNGHLVTWEGSGHTAYGRSNACVTNTVDDYFVKGSVPASDPHC
jgi:pimeloyl-ACP methyl ester carboxylesterase